MLFQGVLRDGKGQLYPVVSQNTPEPRFAITPSTTMVFR